MFFDQFIFWGQNVFLLSISSKNFFKSLIAFQRQNDRLARTGPI